MPAPSFCGETQGSQENIFAGADLLHNSRFFRLIFLPPNCALGSVQFFPPLRQRITPPPPKFTFSPLQMHTGSTTYCRNLHSHKGRSVSLKEIIIFSHFFFLHRARRKKKSGKRGIGCLSFSFLSPSFSGFNCSVIKNRLSTLEKLCRHFLLFPFGWLIGSFWNWMFLLFCLSVGGMIGVLHWCNKGKYAAKKVINIKDTGTSVSSSHPFPSKYTLRIVQNR